jgi:membrane protein required for colicin V production
MTIPIFDVILVVILAGFTFYGLFFGLIRTIGSIVGVVVGTYVAGHYYLNAFALVKDLFFSHDNLGKVITFVIVFSITNRLVGFLFSLLDKTFGILSIIPFLKTINRLAGAALGFVEGGLILGLILFVASRYAFIGSWFGDWMVGSQVAPFLIHFNNVLMPLLPDALKKLSSLI